MQSEEGYFFLHKVLISSLLTFVSTGHCGIRRFCRWLNDSGLSDFVASSYGIWQNIAKDVEKTISKFGKENQEILSKQMPFKEISFAIDETFFPAICLVGIEPVSGFILIEKFSDKRDAASWELAALSSTKQKNLNQLKIAKFLKVVFLKRIKK